MSTGRGRIRVHRRRLAQKRRPMDRPRSSLGGGGSRRRGRVHRTRTTTEEIRRVVPVRTRSTEGAQRSRIPPAIRPGRPGGHGRKTERTDSSGKSSIEREKDFAGHDSTIRGGRRQRSRQHKTSPRSVLPIPHGLSQHDNLDTQRHTLSVSGLPGTIAVFVCFRLGSGRWSLRFEETLLQDRALVGPRGNRPLAILHARPVRSKMVQDAKHSVSRIQPDGGDAEAKTPRRVPEALEGLHDPAPLSKHRLRHSKRQSGLQRPVDSTRSVARVSSISKGNRETIRNRWES
mmetsp:Transcript_439/g.995  ORF Transcript_439/g.995 Transcript_439/m.995 type:complete len:288 (-) Transcript_439:1598-2461(-)